MEMYTNFELFLGTVAGSIIQLQSHKINDRQVHLRNDQKCEISTLAWGRSNQEIILGYKLGNAKIFNTVTNKAITIQKLEDCRIVGAAAHEKSVLLATHTGNVYQWHKGKTELYINNTDSTKTLEKLIVNPHKPHTFAIGGVLNDIKVYDITTKQITFQGKSDKHDELNLQQPISINGIAFFNDGAGIDIGTVTKQGQLRIYDTRAQRRPIKIFKNKDSVYTTIAATNTNEKVVVGSSRGHLQLMDLRNTIKPLKTFKGFMGGITDIICDYEAPIVVSCSLDRQFRIHNLENMKEEHKEYMKIQMTQMLMRPKHFVVPTSEPVVEVTENINAAQHENDVLEDEVVILEDAYVANGDTAASKNHTAKRKKSINKLSAKISKRCISDQTLN